MPLDSRAVAEGEPPAAVDVTCPWPTTFTVIPAKRNEEPGPGFGFMQIAGKLSGSRVAPPRRPG